MKTIHYEDEVERDYDDDEEVEVVSMMPTGKARGQLKAESDRLLEKLHAREGEKNYFFLLDTARKMKNTLFS